MTNIPKSRVMRIVRHLRKQGIESTPSEVLENLIEVARKVRGELKRLDWENVPKDDVGVLDLMAEIQRGAK